jgi:ankyrin repeat protein
MHLLGVNTSFQQHRHGGGKLPDLKLSAPHFCKQSCTFIMPINQNQDINHQLREASMGGDYARVLALLGDGAEIDATDGLGATALFYASQNGYAKTVEILLLHGANIHIMDISGRSALMQAKDCEEDEVVEILMAAGATFHLVINEAKNDFQKVKASLENPHATDLMRAAYGGEQDAVNDALLENPTSIEAVNEGWTAMMYALSKGKFDVANSLATPATANHDGQLMLSAYYGVDRMITELLGQHTDILDLDCAGPRWTPLMLANEKSDAAEILLEAAIVQLIAVPDGLS